MTHSIPQHTSPARRLALTGSVQANTLAWMVAAIILALTLGVGVAGWAGLLAEKGPTSSPQRPGVPAGPPINGF